MEKQTLNWTLKMERETENVNEFTPGVKNADLETLPPTQYTHS